MIIKCLCGGNMRISKDDFDRFLKGTKFCCHKCKITIKDIIDGFLKGRYYIHFKNADEHFSFMLAINEKVKTVTGRKPSETKYQNGQPYCRVRFERGFEGLVFADRLIMEEKCKHFGIEVIEFDSLKKI